MNYRKIHQKWIIVKMTLQSANHYFGILLIFEFQANVKPLALGVPRRLLTESAQSATAQIRNIGELFEGQRGMPSSHALAGCYVTITLGCDCRWSAWKSRRMVLSERNAWLMVRRLPRLVNGSFLGPMATLWL